MYVPEGKGLKSLMKQKEANRRAALDALITVQSRRSAAAVAIVASATERAKKS